MDWKKQIPTEVQKQRIKRNQLFEYKTMHCLYHSSFQNILNLTYMNTVAICNEKHIIVLYVEHFN